MTRQDFIQAVARMGATLPAEDCRPIALIAIDEHADGTALYFATCAGVDMRQIRALCRSIADAAEHAVEVTEGHPKP